jgi:hypothetical protein
VQRLAQQAAGDDGVEMLEQHRLDRCQDRTAEFVTQSLAFCG